MEDCLVKALMVLYGETVVMTGRGTSVRLNVKAGVPHGSVLSHLLCAIVTDVVVKVAGGRLLRELLYADDLIVMAMAMEEPRKKLAD